MRLFVGALGYSVRSDVLAAAALEFASSVSASVVIDRETKRSKGFGFLDVPDIEAAHVIRSLDGQDVGGRRIIVNEAKPVQPKDERYWLNLLRRSDTTAISREQLRDVLDTTLRGEATDTVFGPSWHGEDGRASDAPRLAFVDDRLVDWLTRNPWEMRTLTAHAFERFCAEMMVRLGCHHVRLTPPGADGGIDIFAVKADPLTGDSSYAIQCKRRRPDNTVGRPAVQQLWGVFNDSEHGRMTKVILATTSYFTAPAREFQRGKETQLELRDYDGVRAWLDTAAAASRSSAD